MACPEYRVLPAFNVWRTAGEIVMAHPWVAWFMGRDEDASRSYDFIAERPVWKTWWFRIGIIAVCLVLLWLFLR